MFAYSIHLHTYAYILYITHWTLSFLHWIHWIHWIAGFGVVLSFPSAKWILKRWQSVFSSSVARWSPCELIHSDFKSGKKSTMEGPWITLHCRSACLFVSAVMYCLCCRLGELSRSRLFERSKWIVHKAQHRQQRAQFNREQQGSAGHEFILDGGAIAKIPPKSDT